MSAPRNGIRTRNHERRTLNAQFEEEDRRYVPQYDEAGRAQKKKNLDKLDAKIQMANGGVDRDVFFLDKGIDALADEVLTARGINRPEPRRLKQDEGEDDQAWIDYNIAHTKAVSEYNTQRDKVADDALANLYVSMSEDNRPFDIKLVDGSSQKTLESAAIEDHDEKAKKEKKPKGNRAGKVKKSKLDDGSEAEAASEAETTGLTDLENVAESGDSSDNDADKSTDDMGKPVPTADLQSTPDTDASSAEVGESGKSDTEKSAPTKDATTATATKLEQQVAAEEKKYANEKKDRSTESKDNAPTAGKAPSASGTPSSSTAGTAKGKPSTSSSVVPIQTATSKANKPSTKSTTPSAGGKGKKDQLTLSPPPPRASKKA